MSISVKDLGMIRAVFHDTLEQFAVPKPSRISEHYAALTLSIVLLREQVAGDNTPPDRTLVVAREIDEILKKRAELEDILEAGCS